MRDRTDTSSDERDSGLPDPALALSGAVSPGWLGDFSITISSHPGSDVVSLRGELDLVGAGGLRACLARLHAPTVVVEVSRLSFIDAAGISALVLAYTRATHEGRSLVLRGAEGIVLQVLELTGLSYLLDADISAASLAIAGGTQDC